MKLEDLKKKLLNSKEFRDEYFKKDLAFEVGQMVLEARAIKGISQKELAELAGTKQPGIARVENGGLPSLSFLEKLAKAMDTYLIPPRFGFMKNTESEAYTERQSQYVTVSLGSNALNSIVGFTFKSNASSIGENNYLLNRI